MFVLSALFPKDQPVLEANRAQTPTQSNTKKNIGKALCAIALVGTAVALGRGDLRILCVSISVGAVGTAVLKPPVASQASASAKQEVVIDLTRKEEPAALPKGKKDPEVIEIEDDEALVDLSSDSDDEVEEVAPEHAKKEPVEAKQPAAVVDMSGDSDDEVEVASPHFTEEGLINIEAEAKALLGEEKAKRLIELLRKEPRKDELRQAEYYRVLELEGNSWANDEVINKALHGMIRVYACSGKRTSNFKEGQENTFLMNSYFISKLVRKTESFENLFRWFKGRRKNLQKESTFAYDRILLPLNHFVKGHKKAADGSVIANDQGMHWGFVEVLPKEGVIRYHDSLKWGAMDDLRELERYFKFHAQEEFKRAEKALEQEGLSEERIAELEKERDTAKSAQGIQWKIEQNREYPQQKNGRDCGFFMLAGMHQLVSTGKVGHIDRKSSRREVLELLLSYEEGLHS